MDTEHKHYYARNEFLLSSIGVWYFQGTLSRILARSVFFILTSLLIILQIAYLISIAWPNMRLILFWARLSIPRIIVLTKYLNCFVNGYKIKKMFEIMFAKDVSLDAEETKIVTRHMERGRNITHIWLWFIVSSFVLFMIIGLPPQIIAKWRDPSVKLPIPGPFYYGKHVDQHKYHFAICAHIYLTIFYFLYTTASVDGIFAVVAEYACAQFALVCHKLETAVGDDDGKNNIDVKIEVDMPYKKYCESIARHNRALEFVEMIESAHKNSFLITVGLNVILVSFNAIPLLMGTADRVYLLRAVPTLAVSLLRLYFENYFSQRLTDFSNSVYGSLVSSQWYRTSRRTKKLIPIFIMKSLTPSMLTVGGLVEMSMANFSAVFKASMSYVTVLRSFQ